MNTNTESESESELNNNGKWKIEILEYSDVKKELKKKKKISSPFITKYEKARLIGTRAVQIENDADLLVEIDTEFEEVENYSNPIWIAEQEFMAKKLPLIICRIFPDESKEYWTLDELIY